MPNKTRAIGLFVLALSLYILLVFYDRGYRLSLATGFTHVPIVATGMGENGGVRIRVKTISREGDQVTAQMSYRHMGLRHREAPPDTGEPVRVHVVFYGDGLPDLPNQTLGEPIVPPVEPGTDFEKQIVFTIPEGATHYAIAAESLNLVTGRLRVPR